MPELALAGTLTVRLVAVALETVADVPLNFTTLLVAVVEKLVPSIITFVPAEPEVGENPVRVGAGIAGFGDSSLLLHPLHRREIKTLTAIK